MQNRIFNLFLLLYLIRRSTFKIYVSVIVHLFTMIWQYHYVIVIARFNERFVVLDAFS